MLKTMARDFLMGIAGGEMILTLALTEHSAEYTATGIATKAVPDNGNFIVDGTKLFVPYAHVSDYLLSVGRTGDSITLLLTDAHSSALRCSE